MVLTGLSQIERSELVTLFGDYIRMLNALRAEKQVRALISLMVTSLCKAC